MEATFEIQVDVPRDLLRIRLAGFFTPASLAAFVVARQEALGRLRCPVERHLALTDVRNIQIQSQEMVAAFSAFLTDRSTQSRRLALVIAGTLARHQVQRAIRTRTARCFTDAAEAECWLLDDRSQAA